MVTTCATPEWAVLPGEQMSEQGGGALPLPRDRGRAPFVRRPSATWVPPRPAPLSSLRFLGVRSLTAAAPGSVSFLKIGGSSFCVRPFRCREPSGDDGNSPGPADRRGGSTPWRSVVVPTPERDAGRRTYSYAGDHSGVRLPGLDLPAPSCATDSEDRRPPSFPRTRREHRLGPAARCKLRLLIRLTVGQFVSQSVKLSWNQNYDSEQFLIYFLFFSFF